MAVGVAHVEVPLAPGSINRVGVGFGAGGQHPGMRGIHVVNPENHPTPDGPQGSMLGVELEVQESRSSLQAREVGVGTAVGHLKTDRRVEPHGTGHVGHGEGDGAD
jgi:hypothetical protein